MPWTNFRRAAGPFTAIYGHEALLTQYDTWDHSGRWLCIGRTVGGPQLRGAGQYGSSVAAVTHQLYASQDPTPLINEDSLDVQSS